MRSLDISEENLKNQQAVVSEEVRVNVLNQPYQFFEWISLWENAFTNWNNSHNGYGELSEINAATIEDVRNFFKTYYAPNNAVLTVVGDVDVNEVKKMVEKHFASIPSQPMPARADLSEPAQTKEKRVSQTDKLANLPALATGYHLPPQNSPDFPAMALLVQILQSGESSRWYQRLVKEKELTLDLSGGLNYFGNEFDYTGPMIMTTRTTYKPGHTADEVLREMDAVIADITDERRNGEGSGRRQSPISLQLLQPARIEFRQDALAVGARALPRQSAADQFIADSVRERHRRADQNCRREVSGRYESHRDRSRSRSESATQRQGISHGLFTD